MVAKVIATLVALIVGGWMIFDGIHVLATGKYFGPDKPGPWADLVAAAGLDPFRLGLPFVALGVLWLVSHSALLRHRPRARQAALLTAILTLWYLPVGTILSLLYILLLFLSRSTDGSTGEAASETKSGDVPSD